MSRIIAGQFGGRRVNTPPGNQTRPTSDRVREALFSKLDHEIELHHARLLDVYAGSGALALEGVSRGASVALCIESSRMAAGVIRGNAELLGVAAQIRVLAEAAEVALATTPTAHYDVALLDPPYDIAETDLRDVLALLMTRHWLAPGAVVVVERSSRGPEPGWPDGMTRFATSRHGETILWWAETVAEDQVA